MLGVLLITACTNMRVDTVEADAGEVTVIIDGVTWLCTPEQPPVEQGCIPYDLGFTGEQEQIVINYCNEGVTEVLCKDSERMEFCYWVE